MGLSIAEQATLYFYEWEYRNRGYYHFDTPVDIEPPYIPFHHRNYRESYTIDDGRVPSIFNSIGKLLNPPKEESQQEESLSITPTLLSFDNKPECVGFSLSFPKGQEIIPQRNQAFLNMLSFTAHPITFEILGTSDDITIQIVASESDKERIYSHMISYFPAGVLQEIDVSDFGFNMERDIAIADFGVHDEFMRPIEVYDSFAIDPLTSIIATMDSLQSNDIALFQVLFKGITSPLAKDIPYAASDGQGGSFFGDAPEMPNCAIDKISAPLFSVVMRIATQGEDEHRSRYLAQELARGITSVSNSQFNKLIPLSNEGYDYDFHHYNVHHRLSNRLGFILNSKELSTFVHYPNRSIVSAKLGLQGGKTKKLPQEAINQEYVLGVNSHNGNETEVMLNDDMRLRHTHIIGATGTGKSTLIATMMIEDMNAGNGCALFDPHGDIVEDILLRIPEHRKNGVIIIDPSDTEFPIGFNLLQATTDAEKIVLSSDLVSAFKRHATAWGDTMTSVLSNAINTFLESSKGGTLIELKRFLLEASFRKEFLASVEDPSIHYYWNNEYHMVKKSIAPLLTRIDTFLRPKIVRYMLAQNSGIDFKACIDEKKILLIKLSQGQIGEENSYLLGSLFLSKMNQVAQGRQSLPKEQRHPYYLYLDEFQNFITPSITRILSGARKYGLGLVLAHQELGQIDDPKVLNSVISNPHTRICFRLGDSDAKRLESGFSYFEQSDLQSLSVGQAIIRLGSSSNDFNLATSQLPQPLPNAEETKQYIIENTRNHHAKPRKDIEKRILDQLPKITKKDTTIESVTQADPQISNSEAALTVEEKPTSTEIKKVKVSEEVREKLIVQEEISISNRDHSYLQNVIRKLGQERDFVSTIEKETSGGGRIDVVLEKGVSRTAFEISITNTPEYEVKNIKKCLADGYLPVVMVSKNKNHLNKIERLAEKELSQKDFQMIRFVQPDGVVGILNGMSKKSNQSQETVKGFRITTQFEQSKPIDAKGIRQHIAKLLFKKK